MAGPQVGGLRFAADVGSDRPSKGDHQIVNAETNGTEISKNRLPRSPDSPRIRGSKLLK